MSNPTILEKFNWIRSEIYRPAFQNWLRDHSVQLTTRFNNTINEVAIIVSIHINGSFDSAEMSLTNDLGFAEMMNIIRRTITTHITSVRQARIQREMVGSTQAIRAPIRTSVAPLSHYLRPSQEQFFRGEAFKPKKEKAPKVEENLPKRRIRITRKSE